MKLTTTAKPAGNLLATMLHANIKTLAHYLHVLRGCKPGRADSDWLEAEEQLTARLNEDGYRGAPPSRYVE